MKNIVIILTTLLVSGCVTGNYQSFNSGIGYQETQLENNGYLVSYTGTSTTNIKKVNDFALLRCSEITLHNGYKYFVITEATNNRHLLKNTTNSSTEVARRDWGQPSMPGTWAGSNSPKAKSELNIYLYHEKPDGIVYDAEIIRRAIINEYEIEEGV